MLPVHVRSKVGEGAVTAWADAVRDAPFGLRELALDGGLGTLRREEVVLRVAKPVGRIVELPLELLFAVLLTVARPVPVGAVERPVVLPAPILVVGRDAVDHSAVRALVQLQCDCLGLTHANSP